MERMAAARREMQKQQTSRRSKISWRISRREVEKVTLAKLVDQPTEDFRASTKLEIRLRVVQSSKKSGKKIGSWSKKIKKAMVTINV